MEAFSDHRIHRSPWVPPRAKIAAAKPGKPDNTNQEILPPPVTNVRPSIWGTPIPTIIAATKPGDQQTEKKAKNESVHFAPSVDLIPRRPLQESPSCILNKASPTRHLDIHSVRTVYRIQGLGGMQELHLPSASLHAAATSDQRPGH